MLLVKIVLQRIDVKHLGIEVTQGEPPNYSLNLIRENNQQTSPYLRWGTTNSDLPHVQKGTKDTLKSTP